MALHSQLSAAARDIAVARGASGKISEPICQSVAISGHQWPSVAISGHQWPSVAISGHQWPSVAISGHQWPSVATCHAIGPGPNSKAVTKQRTARMESTPRALEATPAALATRTPVSRRAEDSMPLVPNSRSFFLPRRSIKGTAQSIARTLMAEARRVPTYR